MSTLHAVILHRHALFRDLIAFALRELGEVEVVDATDSASEALEMVLRRGANALVVENTDNFLERRDMLQLFCDAAERSPRFVLIAAGLQSSRIEVLSDSVGEKDHLRELEPILHGVAT
jgi:DNA-binding NarL/FixJ family response regulator